MSFIDKLAALKLTNNDEKWLYIMKTESGYECSYEEICSNDKVILKYRTPYYKQLCQALCELKYVDDCSILCMLSCTVKKLEKEHQIKTIREMAAIIHSDECRQFINEEQTSVDKAESYAVINNILSSGDFEYFEYSKDFILEKSLFRQITIELMERHLPILTDDEIRSCIEQHSYIKYEKRSLGYVPLWGYSFTKDGIILA